MIDIDEAKKLIGLVVHTVVNVECIEEGFMQRSPKNF